MLVVQDSSSYLRDWSLFAHFLKVFFFWSAVWQIYGIPLIIYSSLSFSVFCYPSYFQILCWWCKSLCICSLFHTRYALAFILPSIWSVDHLIEFSSCSGMMHNKWKVFQRGVQLKHINCVVFLFHSAHLCGRLVFQHILKLAIILHFHVVRIMVTTNQSLMTMVLHRDIG